MSNATSGHGGLTFKLRAEPSQRVDLGRLLPGTLATLSVGEIERVDIGTGPHPLHVGDLFAVSGTPGDSVVFEGGSSRFDNVGATHAGGRITVDGDVGAYAGRLMRAGHLDIRGNAGPFLASRLADGLVTVGGNAGDYLGGPRPGEKDGLAGGAVVVGGSAGAYCGTRTRRGLIVLKQGAGDNAGARMMGGTIWAIGGFGNSAGVQMRRGTLLTPRLGQPLPTYLDCGMHDLGILRIMSRHYAGLLGDAAPSLPTGRVQRFVGDMAHLGKGEILVTG